MICMLKSGVGRLTFPVRLIQEESPVVFQVQVFEGLRGGNRILFFEIGDDGTPTGFNFFEIGDHLAEKIFSSFMEKILDIMKFEIRDLKQTLTDYKVELQMLEKRYLNDD